MAPTVTTGCPEIPGGYGGSSVAVSKANDSASSSAAVSRYSRNRSAISCARAAGNAIAPFTTSRPSSCNRNSNEVTTPKFGPAPRIPQKRSGCSVSLTCSRSPAAVTRSTESRLSIV